METNEVFKALTDEDRNKIDCYIKYYAPSDNDDVNNDDRACLEYVLKPWSEAKVDLFEKFGKQLILTEDYKYDESTNLLERRLLNTTSWRTISDKLYEKLAYAFRHNTLQMISPDIDYFGLPMYFSASECIKNKLEGSYSFTYNGKKYVFNPGMKYMKFLGKLAELMDMKDEFEKFRVEHSMVLNNAKLHGNLCLSIHPLDYMTMSDNYSDWESCMSWMHCGCYRMGTVEMMNSPMVVVAYLAASEPMNFGSYEWNNKKWRQLFVLNEHVITAVKAYPYQDDNLTKECLRWLNKLTGNEYSEEDFLFDSGENRYLNYYRLNATTHNMYNDFASCTHLTKIKLPVPEKREGKVIRWSFCYSGDTECMWCGSTDGDFSEDSLICSDCGGGNRYVHCCHCGSRIDPDYDNYFCTDDGDYYCEDCRDEFFTWDEIHEEYIDNDDAIEVYLCSHRTELKEDEEYNDSDHKFINYHKDRHLWTHYDIRDSLYCGQEFVHENEYGEYFIFIDEAPKRILTAFFGCGTYALQDLRRYADESYVGYKCANIGDGSWWCTTEPVDIKPEEKEE